MQIFKNHDCNLAVKLSGGLGNQLFQISNIISLGLELGRPVIFNDSSYEFDRKRTSTLSHFNIHPNKPYAIRKIGEHIDLEVSNSKCVCKSIDIVEQNFEYYPLHIPTSSVLLHGYWQSEKYFVKHSLAIRKFLRSKLEIDNKPLLSQNTIHIRLGDILNNLEIREIHGLLPTEYFISAIMKISNIFDFSIVSDSIVDAAGMHLESFQSHYPDVKFTFVTNTSDYEDFSLMIKSKNLILSNSTFSWWGAYLSDATNIIAPKMLFSENKMKSISTRDFWLPTWNLI